VPRVDVRRVLNGIFRRTGTLGRNPKRYGPAHHLHEPLYRWRRADAVSKAYAMRRHPDDRQLQHPRAPARCQRQKKGPIQLQGSFADQAGRFETGFIDANLDAISL
jgi:hypothetical protein